jgi:hypothetical protein
MKLGDKYKFKDLIKGGPADQPEAQLPNEFTLTYVDPGFTTFGLIQTGQVGKEPAWFSSENFERDFEPIP